MQTIGTLRQSRQRRRTPAEDHTIQHGRSQFHVLHSSGCQAILLVVASRAQEFRARSFARTLLPWRKSCESHTGLSRPKFVLIAAFVVMAILSSPSAAFAQDGRAGEFRFDFESDPEGWTAGFADLPVDYDRSIYELDQGHRPLPDGLAGSGICVQGHNRSDDLFMFLKRRV